MGPGGRVLLGPAYRTLHQEVAVLEGQPVAAIFKGGAGEVQRNPLKPCRVAWVCNGQTSEEDWPALLPGLAYKWRDEPLGTERLAALWRGEIDLPAPEAAVTGTVTLALSALGRAKDKAEAQAMAEAMWRARPKEKIDAAAALSA